MNTNKTLIIYCDGSCSKNHCGSGIFIPKQSLSNELQKSYPVKGEKTNQRAELTAILESIKSAHNIFLLNPFQKLIIRSDSIYSIKCVSEWYPKWIMNNWMRTPKEEVKNKDIITEILSIMHMVSFNISFEHVKAHQKEPEHNDPKWNTWYGNKIADELATKKD